MKIIALKNFAKNIRKNIIYTAFKAGSKSAHIGGALSVADIIAVLYSDIIRIKKTKILDDSRDRFILSKGHACLALYSALVEKKLLKRKDIYDCEFIVTGIVEMEGNMAGSVNIDLGTASGGGDELAGLNTTAIQNAGMARGWDDDKCRELLRDQDIRVNTVATIEHFGVTNKGKLRFAKIKAFRDYE